MGGRGMCWGRSFFFFASCAFWTVAFDVRVVLYSSIV